MRGNKLGGKGVRWEGPLPPKRWWAPQKIVNNSNMIGIIASEREQEGARGEQDTKRWEEGEYLGSTLPHT